jgi:hypothetical protein
VDDDRVGAIAARKRALFRTRRVSHLDAVISARIGNEQSLGVYSIPDGSALGETNERNTPDSVERLGI